MSIAIWEALRCFWLMFIALLELRSLRKCLAKIVGKDVYGHNKEGLNFEESLNFPLEQNVEEETHLFSLIIMLQIF